MSINYAILGILSYQPFTGYELKKIIQDSPFMYWSGNNNQIYKALLELRNEGLVTSEVHHQESSPSKKIYTVTEEGLAALRHWILTASEPPELKKTFLIQLAWADLLSAAELDSLISGYENQVQTQLLMQREYLRRKNLAPDRTPRELLLWDLIHGNLIASCENELNWIQQVRRALCGNMEKETRKMQFQLVEKTNGKYLECVSAATPLGTEQDALDLVALCGENETHFLIIHAAALSGDFFKLRTGVAGRMLQKLINYRVKIALVLTDAQVIKGKFAEMLAESHRGGDFRVFQSIPAAEDWFFKY